MITVLLDRFAIPNGGPFTKRQVSGWLPKKISNLKITRKNGDVLPAQKFGCAVAAVMAECANLRRGARNSLFYLPHERVIACGFPANIPLRPLHVHALNLPGRCPSLAPPVREADSSAASRCAG